MLFFRQSKILLFDGGGGENKNFFFPSFGDRPSLHKLFFEKETD
ncbi:hypothetical protein O176_01405 [Chlamydia trachomatis]|nr:hypothetical protein O172_01405 [Chlamydia trachomatis]AGT69505.1 hypothetical protein O176_01405 [Chlamydia trachomatis]